MTPEQVIERLKVIRKTNPGNLVARHFDETYFRALDDPSRLRLMKIIASGIENPDSRMGAYAMNAEDYEHFAPMLGPMIRDFHGIPVDMDIAQKSDWDFGGMSCDIAATESRLKDMSIRVRVARNVSTFSLPGAMTKEERVALEHLATQAFAALRESSEFGGRYLSITPDSPDKINASEYHRRVEAHQMFKDMSADSYLNMAGISADWPYGRGMYLSQDEDFLVWVGEEDHLRFIALQQGGNLNALFERLRIGLERLQDLLPAFVTSPCYGNVTSCPTNLGTGMRASVHMLLPRLTSNGRDLARLTRLANALGLDVRGAGGEHSDPREDGLVDISPRARLGLTEAAIMHRLYEGATALRAVEAG
nr:MAG: arginine kinase [Hyphomicrobiales bacterium]